MTGLRAGLPAGQNNDFAEVTDMKRILICGMLFALATSLSFAQRSRGVGPSTGVGAATGHMGPAARMPATGPMSPTTSARPDMTDTGRVAPDAANNHANAPSTDTTSVGPAGAKPAPDTTGVGPDVGRPANSTGVGSHNSTVPDRTTMPDANGVSDHTMIIPNQ
jgi:hypothetical protein